MQKYFYHSTTDKKKYTSVTLEGLSVTFCAAVRDLGVIFVSSLLFEAQITVFFSSQKYC